MADAFDPDAYLRKPPAFDPDAYLNATREATPLGHVKAAGVGLAETGIGLAGSDVPLDVLGASKLAGLAGYDLPAEKVAAVTRYLSPLNLGPSSGKIKAAAESIFGKFYQPVGEEKYTRTAASFIPAALVPQRAAPTLAREIPAVISRLGRQAVIPGVASEAAGQAAEAYAPEYAPAARVVTGLGTSLATAPRQISTAKLTPAQIEARATAGYQSPEVQGLVFRQQAADDLVDSIKASLRRGKANERLAPQTNALVDDLRVPVSGRHMYEDLQVTRELLGKQAGNFANPQEQRAASVALEKLTNYIDNIPQADLVAGNAAAASRTLAAARGDYAAAKTAERVAEKVYAAELQAGSAHSGGNIQNALRQKQKQLLTQKGRRGLTEAELAQVEEGVTGSLPANLLRAGGKLLAGGGGMGSVVSGYVGHAALGPFGAAAPAVGYAVKRIGDVVAQRKADELVQAILGRAPSAPRQTRTNIRQYDPRGRIAQLLGIEAALEQRRR